MASGHNLAQFRIRRATADDLSLLTPLLERYYEEWRVVERDSREQIEAYLHQPAPFGFVLAEERGGLVGCVLLRPLPSIALAGECKRLYIIPEHRGEGFASLLMDFVEGFATERLDWIYLDTGAEFIAAQSLYRARGYETCERYNDNPQATCFFRKRLLT
jgi:ribosomal protein S18 acetylase RimI-like enzyme